MSPKHWVGFTTLLLLLAASAAQAEADSQAVSRVEVGSRIESGNAEFGVATQRIKGTKSYKLQVWRLSDATMTWEVEFPEDTYRPSVSLDGTAIAFSEGQDLFYAQPGRRIRTARATRPVAGRSPRTPSAQGYANIATLAISPDGGRIMTFDSPNKKSRKGPSVGALRIWNASAWGSHRVIAETDSIRFRDAVFSQDGSLVVANGEGTIHVWNAQSGETLHRLGGRFSELSGDGQLIAGHWGDRLRIWDASTGRLESTLPKHHVSSISQITISNGGKLAAFLDFGKVHVWRIGTNAVWRVREIDNAEFLQFLADGRLLAIERKGGWAYIEPSQLMQSPATDPETREPVLEPESLTGEDTRSATPEQLLGVWKLRARREHGKRFYKPEELYYRFANGQVEVNDRDNFFEDKTKRYATTNGANAGELDVEIGEGKVLQVYYVVHGEGALTIYHRRPNAPRPLPSEYGDSDVTMLELSRQT